MHLEMTMEDQVEFIQEETIVGDGIDGDIDDQQSQSQPYWIETALDWWERSHASKRIVPTDPVTAARAFLRGDVPTGIGFVDEALLLERRFGTTKHSTHYRREAPILELLMATTTPMTPGTTSTGGSGAATWTLISLAARFVVATRPSRFVSSPLSSEPSLPTATTMSTTPSTSSPCTPTTIQQLPMVILMDPFHSIDMHDLVSAVRSTWLLQQEHSEDTSEANTQAVVEECLSRIHMLFPSPDTLCTVAVLEALQCRFAGCGGISNESCNNENVRGRISEHNNLLLWDNFLSTIPNANGKQEVIRQLMRLWRATNLMVVVASSRSYSEFDDSCVTCRIRLEQDTFASASPDSDEDDNRQQIPQYGLKATLLSGQNQQVVPFTIGTAGILS